MAKEEVILDFKVEQGEAIKDLEQTKVAIINLKKEQKDLNDQYKKGSISTEQYAKSSVKLEGELKKNTTAYNENLKASKGITTQFDKLTQSLDKMVPGMGGVTSGFNGITKGALGFIATPIGAVIGALGLALAAVTSYLKGTEEGQHKLNKIMNVGGAILGKITDAVQALGKFIFDYLIKGFTLFGDALSYIIPGFDIFVKKAEEFLNLDTASKISEMEERRVLLNRELITQRDILKEEIKAAKLRAEGTKDVRLRAAALKEATDKTNELFAKEKELAKLDSDILIEKGKQANNDIAANDAIEEGKAKINRLETERLGQLTEITTKQLALSEQDKAITQKKLDAIVAIREAENIAEGDAVIRFAAEEERHRRELEKINERIQAWESEETIMRRRIANLDLESDLVDESADANADYAKELARLNKIKADTNKAEQDSQNLQMQGVNLLAQIGGKNKAAASAAALIATYLSASKAYTSQLILGDPTSIIRAYVAAALATASGLARVAAINNITAAAGGGSFETRGPQLMVVGDNPGGRERVDVTPLSGKGQTRVGGGMIHMAGGGSVVANSSSAKIDSNFGSIMKGLNLSVSWREGQDLGEKVKFKEKLVSL